MSENDFFTIFKNMVIKKPTNSYFNFFPSVRGEKGARFIVRTYQIDLFEESNR